jgi:hypothetical protein
MSPVKYELGFYITEDDILHSHRRENLKSYMVSVGLMDRAKAVISKVRQYYIQCRLVCSF